MKLRSLICVSAVAAASAAFALDGGNTFARLRVDTGSITNSIIAIPFAGCGESAAEIYVTNLVMTTNLSTGDTLMYHNDESWFAWEIQGAPSNPHWVAVVAGDRNGVHVSQPQDFKMLCGKACWLIRQSSSAPVYLYGQVTNELRSVYVNGATGSNAYGYTLIAKPSESDALDLNTWHPSAANTDDLLIVPEANAMGQKTYRYSKTDNAWQTVSQSTSTVTNPRTKETRVVTNSTWTVISSSTTIPAGKGVMYGRKGTSGATLAW